MKVFHALKNLPSTKKPVGFAIGNFDGMHLGHIQIFQRLRSLVTKEGVVAALTFKNHPIEYFRPSSSFCYLSSYEQRMLWFKKLGVDLVIVLHFDHHMAEKPYDHFLDEVQKALPFSFLVRGKGSVLGKNREGTEKNVKSYGKKHGIATQFIDLVSKDQTPIHSGMIRQLVREGELKKAQEFLGRPYGLWIEDFLSKTDGRLNIECFIKKICLPPQASYPAELLQKDLCIQGELAISSTVQFTSLYHDSFDRNAPFLLNFL